MQHNVFILTVIKHFTTKKYRNRTRESHVEITIVPEIINAVHGR
jgi:hypothetical protein